MASVIKVGGKWRAQVRRKGFPTETCSFDVKAQASAWAAKIEADMLALKHQDTRIIANLTMADLIDRYSLEVGGVKAFGKNKVSVLAMLKEDLGKHTLPSVTVDVLMHYIRKRHAAGAGGVTIAIDLSYLGSMYRAAQVLFRLPVDPTVIKAARANLQYLGLSTKSKERERRPTKAEITKICAHFKAKKRQRVPMIDVITFAIETAMRAGEIIRLKWSDLNDDDRTIIIRDRKHPQLKEGNDQEVPLLGEAYAIVKRQPRIEDEPRIFPVTDGTISTLFPRACEALDIEDLTFHDLRHEGISRLFEQGYTMEQVMLVSGHRDPKMLMRYVQLRAKDLHRAPATTGVQFDLK
jgi:integrase